MFFVVEFLLFKIVFGLDNGLGLTPPMGWNNWVQFRCEIDCTTNPTTCISEQLITETIDHIYSDGWLNAGYEYVIIDDCWSSNERESNEDISANSTRFSRGIKWLADYAHERGVKLGITNTYGTKSCGNFTGSEGYLLRDAQTFADWGIDYLKMTACNSKALDKRDGYESMHYFLNSTKRPIMYSCSWPAYSPDMDFAELPPHCNLWRAATDASSSWTTLKQIIDKWGDSPQWAQYAGPGHWNDPDMLVIGMLANSRINPISISEARSQMSIWSIIAAPLIMSNDLRNVTDQYRNVLLNEEVIAVNQDSLGKQGTRLTESGNTANVWIRELANGDYAAALLNEGDSTQDIALNFSEFTSTTQFIVRDLWGKYDVGQYEKQFVAQKIPAHDTVMLRLRREK